MTGRLYKLKMEGPFHVGKAGVGYEESLTHLPSDTLFSALIVTWLEMGLQNEVEALLQGFDRGEVGLLLSSGLPYVGETLLFPRPQLPMTPENGGKAYKRVHWVSNAIFRRLANAIDGHALDRLWKEAVLIQGGAVWLTREERDAAVQALYAGETDELTIWARHPVAHVTVDRIGNASNLYHVGQIHFAPQCGLWLMADGAPIWLDRLEEALRTLQHGGIGRRRSRGGGRFQLMGPTDPPVFDAATDYQMLVSRLAPTQAQMTLLKADHSRYGLVTIGGYSSYPRQTPVIRRRVRMLTEGSVIQRGKQTPGKLVDVLPSGAPGKGPLVEHRIVRYGYGLGLPIAIAPDRGQGAER